MTVLLLGGVGVSIPYGLKMWPQLLAAKEKPVYWNVSSSPAAQVIRKADGQMMGMTPWTHTLPQGTGRQMFVLRAQGYVDQEIWFEEGSSASQNVSLVAESKAAPVATVGDGGVAGSAPVIVLQDGGAESPVAERPIVPQGEGHPSPEKSTPGVAAAKPGKPTGLGAGLSSGKSAGNKKLPRLGSDGELLKDDDIAILKDD